MTPSAAEALFKRMLVLTFADHVYVPVVVSVAWIRVHDRLICVLMIVVIDDIGYGEAACF